MLGNIRQRSLHTCLITYSVSFCLAACDQTSLKPNAVLTMFTPPITDANPELDNLQYRYQCAMGYGLLPATDTNATCIVNDLTNIRWVVALQDLPDCQGR